MSGEHSIIRMIQNHVTSPIWLLVDDAKAVSHQKTSLFVFRYSYKHIKITHARSPQYGLHPSSSLFILLHLKSSFLSSLCKFIFCNNPKSHSISYQTYNVRNQDDANFLLAIAAVI